MMRPLLRPLQLAVLAILENAEQYDWSVQGFGMLRLYVRKIGRLHIWDNTLRYPGVSMVHNHSWDLRSTIVSGHLLNTRFKPTRGFIHGASAYHGKRMITGYNCQNVEPLPDTWLYADWPERYSQGNTYWQRANEIHRTDADNGTVSIMERQDDENGQADIYWPKSTEWGTARPRPATHNEVIDSVAKAIQQLERDLA